MAEAPVVNEPSSCGLNVEQDAQLSKPMDQVVSNVEPSEEGLGDVEDGLQTPAAEDFNVPLRRSRRPSKKMAFILIGVVLAFIALEVWIFCLPQVPWLCDKIYFAIALAFQLLMVIASCPLPSNDFLPGVGQDIDSDVGGSGGSAKLAHGELIPVSFWGICDIKYDPRCPVGQRVRILELGDGRSSRFSHHGRYIKEKFDSRYCMVRSPIKRAVMTENKKFTHDMFPRSIYSLWGVDLSQRQDLKFVQEGFAQLRPPTAAYERRYTPLLASSILRDLEVRSGGAVVLKLCNRSRGAGVVVVTDGELDGVLQKLLLPPEKLEEWLEEQREAENLLKEKSLIEEQCYHWKCCSSIPVAKDPDSAELFDGTLRVAFALHRSKAASKYQEELQVKPFEIDWLGGYWKLPKTPLPTNGDKENLQSIHDRIVSSFNSVDKRTAPVPDDQLKEVYDALTPALPQIFSSGAISVQMIMNVYRKENLFCAFALAREPPRNQVAEYLPERSVLSYIDRNVGVCFALLQKWEDAAKHWRSSVHVFPANATSHYLQGKYFQEVGKYNEAVECHMRAIALDPDFKLPLGLGNCQLLRGDLEAAMQACLACFRRHPDAPFAQFIAGQCIYRFLLAPDSARYLSADAKKFLVDKGIRALDMARRRLPEQWNESDQVMLDYLRAPENQHSAAVRLRSKMLDVAHWAFVVMSFGGAIVLRAPESLAFTAGIAASSLAFRLSMRNRCIITSVARTSSLPRISGKSVTNFFLALLILSVTRLLLQLAFGRGFPWDQLFHAIEGKH
eukprot:symbB.v1.2.012683.t2/scaffold880.1/size155533/5